VGRRSRAQSRSRDGAVITGGFSEQELREAGAAAVYESVAELRRHLDEAPFV
jgi:phosphoglycolate phosphatase-like HAD superfamily hydrolase